MSIVGIGVDVVDVARFERVITRTPRLVTRVFTTVEIDLCGGESPRASSLAARWAAKEAVAKVLVDNRGHSWHDCQVHSGPHGEPRVVLSGSVAAAAATRGITSWMLSLSHDGGVAIAFVVATGGPG